MNKKKILIICFIFIFLGICFTLSANKTNVHGLSNIEEISEEYTSSDFFYNGGSTYSIHEYAVSIEDKDYAVHSKNAQLTNVQGEYRLNIQGNDPIVSVIPIDYFKTIGNHLFIGLEYGFFVETIQEKYYNNGVKTSNNYRSTVIVFDIINSTDLVYNIDRALFTVEVLFQIEFAYVVSNEDYFYQRSSVENVSYANDFVNFTNSVTYTLPNGINGYVVPLRDTNNESQISKYYLNDISFGASLQNEQDLNYGDGNYDPYNDIGSYFTRLDYIYNGFYLVEGEVNWGDVGTGLIEGVVSGALGLLPPPYSTIFNVLTLLFDTCDSIIEQSSTKSVSASNDKYIMNAYYQNRDDQIDAYNALSKMAYVSLNTTDDFSILYDVGDYARVEYTINHSALNGVSPNYTRLSSEIALKVVDKDKNLKAIETSCNDHMLREPVEELITIGNSNLISLLSEGNNYFSFTPTYTGKYIFSSQTNTSIAVTFNNSTYMGTNLNITKLLNKDTKYVIHIENYSQTKIIDNFILSVSSEKNNISIATSDTYILKINNTSGFHKLFFANISSTLKLLDSDFNLIKEVECGYMFYSFNSNREYYVLIKNNQNSSITGLFTVTSSVTIMPYNTPTTIPLAKVECFYKYTATSTSNYSVVVFTNTSSSYEFAVYNENQKLVPTVFANSSCITYEYIFENGKNYYIGYENCDGSVGNIELVLKKSDIVFDWYIDNSLVTGEVYLQQNQEFSVSVRVNGRLLNTDIINLATSQVVYKPNSNNVFIVKSNAPVESSNDGRLAVVEGRFNSIIIHIIPVIDISFQLSYTTADTANRIYWTTSQSNYDVSFQVLFTYNDGTTIYKAVSKDKNGYITVPLNGSIIYGINTSIADIKINSITYYQQYSMDGTTIEVTKSYTNSYPSQSNAENSELYFEPVELCMMFAGGSGTRNDPYKIANGWHLNNMRYMTENIRYDDDLFEDMINTHYVVLNSFDVSNFEPLPTLRGDFKGYQNVLKTITINRLKTGTSYGGCGLFKKMRGSMTTISYICVSVNSEKNENGNEQLCKGAIVGMMYEGVISHCQAKGSFSKEYNPYQSYVGGIVGSMQGGVIENSSSTVRINTYGTAGGIAGAMFAGTITGCEYVGVLKLYYVQGSITSVDANPCLGGIAGINYVGSWINNCYVEGVELVTVNGVDKYAIARYMGESCNDEYLKPCIGVIVGRQVYAGNITDVSMNLDTQVIKGNLKELGMLWWKKNQFEYVNTTMAGRIG